jgi:hypothetical protein
VHIGVQKKNKEQTKYGRQITRANHPADTPKQYWKISEEQIFDSSKI